MKRRVIHLKFTLRAIEINTFSLSRYVMVRYVMICCLLIPGDDVKSLPVRFVQLANVGLHAGVTVGVRQQALDGDEDLGEGESRHPVPLLDAVDADVSVPVHVGVEDLGEEEALGR